MKNENQRTSEDKNFIQELKCGQFLAGTDEVGRGPLAGPVIAATVLFTSEKDLVESFKEMESFLSSLGIRDSKKLSEKKRKKIFDGLGLDLETLLSGQIYPLKKGEEGGTLLMAIGSISHEEIDRINILRASQKAMKESFELCYGAAPSNGILLIDGNLKLNLARKEVKEIPLVKGDDRSLLIGLASIVAKSYRDHLMVKLGEKYQGYGLEKHAGYPTKSHKDAIALLGPSPIHRLTFRGVKEYGERAR